MTTVDHLPTGYIPEPGCLNGKIILITGAGDGIGRTAAITFAKYGATVLLLGKNQKKLEGVYDEIESSDYPQPALLPFDLLNNDPAAYKQLAETLRTHFGKLDGLLHNAGVLGDRASIESSKAKAWYDTFQVNLHAPFLLTQALLPLLRIPENASIVFTSSGVGRRGRAYWSAYAASKFATEGLMQVLADEMENASGIRVNAINPGPVRTGMRAKAYPAEDPATVTSAEKIMPLYTYLMSDASIKIHGRSHDAQPC